MRTRRRHVRDHRLEMGQPGNHWCEELVDRRGQRLEASPGRDWRTSMDENRRAIGCGHLWAIGYGDMAGADRVRHEITGLPLPQ
jgi:hypothetical protein